MGVDAYVMPLWRFRTGDVSTAMQRLFGEKAGVITPDGRAVQIGEGKPIDKLEERRCRLWVERTKREVARARPGSTIDWNDDGPTQYAEQANGVLTLATYAMAIQYEDVLGPVTIPENQHPYAHPAWRAFSQNPRPIRHRNLITLRVDVGYLLPCEFDLPVKVDPRVVNGREMYSLASSAPAVLRDVRALREELGIPAGYKGEAHGWPQGAICWTLHELERMLTLSEEHGLPVILWG